jgi:hypothetical protein
MHNNSAYVYQEIKFHYPSHNIVLESELKWEFCGNGSTKACIFIAELPHILCNTYFVLNFSQQSLLQSLSS